MRKRGKILRKRNMKSALLADGKPGSQFKFPLSPMQPDPQSTRFILLEDLKTTALTAERNYRALSDKPWTVYVFIILVSVLLIYFCVLLAIVETQRLVTPMTSSFSEVDVSSKSGNLLPGETFEDYCSALQGARLRNASSTKIVRGVRDKKICIGVTGWPTSKREIPCTRYNGYGRRE